MANTVYSISRSLTVPAERKEAYATAEALFRHLEGLGLQLVSFRVTQGRLEFTLNNPMSEDQRIHIGLTLG